MVAVGNDRQFAAFAAALGLPQLSGDARFATNESRVQHRAELREVLEPALAARPAADWVAAFGAARVPAGLVNTVGEAFAFAEALGLDSVTTTTDPATGHASRQPATPIHLSASPAVHRTPPPPLGAHEPLWLDAVRPSTERITR